MFNKISPKNKNKVGDQSYGNFETSSSIEGAQYTKYRNDKGGGGFAAEDANVLSDRMKAKKSRDGGDQ